MKFLSFALATDLPVVAVISNSMDHGIPEDSTTKFAYPCGRAVDNYTENFDNWWNLCGGSYAKFDISKEEFLNFSFKDGLKKGDMPVVQGNTKYKVGDIIVYTAADCGTRAIIQKVPIIHRIVKIDQNGLIYTQGDHNGSQNPYESCIEAGQVHGRVIFIIPKLGYVKVLVSDIFGV